MALIISFAGIGLSVPLHMVWDLSSEGLLQPRSKPEMWLNVKGGSPEAGRGLVLWNSQPQAHELFHFSGTQIKLVANPGLCLNVEGGIDLGHNFITWPCSSEQELAPNEEFVYELETGLIKLKQHPTLCLNVKGGDLTHGGELIIWQCESVSHELFTVNSNEISMQVNPKLHFKVAAEDVTEVGAKVILYAGRHDVFEFDQVNSRLKLSNTNLCLNAEAGVMPANRIILWPCAEKLADNELFLYDKKSGVISSAIDPELGFNAAGGRLLLGDEIVLWYVQEKTEL